MSLHRREFVASTTRATFAAMLPRILRRERGHSRLAGPGEVITLRDPRIKALALAAVDAARHAGASYADVRVTSTMSRRATCAIGGGASTREEAALGLSVRALVNGYWGWTATPYIAVSEAPRVGQAAVALAKANAASRQLRRVELGTIPVVADGAWATPLTVDPLEVAIPQVRDWVAGIGSFVIGNEGRFTQWPYTATILLQRQERVFASTEGSYLTQTVSVVDPHVGFYYKNHPVVLPIRPAQTGYEYVTETPWQELIQRGMERVEAELQARLPVRVLEIGRYDMILNAEAMAALVGGVFGTAAQADRALGYEANAGGTSYLGPDPLRVLGTPVASPLVTVTADRTTPKAVATVQWDDEGVVPEAFPLVTDGVLVDYETMREQAAWLAPWYAKEGRPVRSHGCAASVDALTLPLQHTPNLTLEPGKEALGFAELVASLDHGLLVEGLELDMDFQVLNGLGTPTRLFEVRRGKLVAQLMGGAGVMVRSPELWKHVKTLGGPASAESLFLNRSTKGEPEQQVSSSVRAVPALITDMALIDVTRRA